MSVAGTGPTGRSLLTLCALLLLLLPPAIAGDEAERPRIQLYTEINHPYFYLDGDSNVPAGIGYRIVMELLDRAGIDHNLTILPWLRAVRATNSDPGSCLFIMNRTKERETSYRWVGPMVNGGIAIFTKPDDTRTITSLEDLRGTSVVGKHDSPSLFGLEETYDIHLIETRSDRQAARIFYSGRGDYWAGGIIDAPLATISLGLPEPKLALMRRRTNLSMGCNTGLDDAIYQKLTETMASMDEFRRAAIRAEQLKHVPADP